MEKKTIELIIEKEDDISILVRQPYATTIARHSLNVHQMRVMGKVIEALQPQMKYDSTVEDIKVEKENRVFKFKASDLMLSGSKNHSLLRKSLKELTLKGISFKKDKLGGFEEINTHLVQYTKYDSRDEFVELEVDRHIMPFLLALSRNYTQYSLKVSFTSSSTYVMRLYQYICQFREKKQISVKADTLRVLLGIQDKYKVLDDLKRRVLLPAIKELKNRADVFFDIHSPMKEGRRVVGWNLNIYTKKTARKTLPKTQPALVLKPKIEASLRRLIVEFGMAPEQTQKFARYATTREFEKALNGIKKQGIKDLPAYTYSVLKATFEKLQETPKPKLESLQEKHKQQALEQAKKEQEQERVRHEEERKYQENLKKEHALTQAQLTKLFKWAESKKGTHRRLVIVLDAVKGSGKSKELLEEKLGLKL